jgi:hypothetical protein
MRKLIVLILMIGCTASYGSGIDYTPESEKPMTRGEFESYKNDIQREEKWREINDSVERLQPYTLRDGTLYKN